MVPLKPERRRKRKGRDAVFVISSEAPTSATLRGESNAWRSTVRFISAFSLIEAPVENTLGDAVFENFDGAARNHPAAGAANAIFHQRFLAVAHAAHDLKRFVGNLPAGEVAGELSDGRVIGRGQTVARIGDGAVEQQLRGVELHRHLR